MSQSSEDGPRTGSRLEADDENHCKKCGWELDEPTVNGLCEQCDAKARETLPTINKARCL